MLYSSTIHTCYPTILTVLSPTTYAITLSSLFSLTRAHLSTPSLPPTLFPRSLRFVLFPHLPRRPFFCFLQKKKVPSINHKLNPGLQGETDVPFHLGADCKPVWAAPDAIIRESWDLKVRACSPFPPSTLDSNPGSSSLCDPSRSALVVRGISMPTRSAAPSPIADRSPRLAVAPSRSFGFRCSFQCPEFLQRCEFPPKPFLGLSLLVLSRLCG